MFKFKLFALLFALLIGATAVHAQTPQASVAITLERSACFGTCPIYSVSILEDGTVLYHGEKFVDVTGDQTGQIDPATVAAMVEAFDKAGYFDWKDAYTEYKVTDLPTITTSVTRNGVTHQIVRYAGDDSAPLTLPYLEQWIDLMAGTGAWTGVRADAVAFSFGSSSPVATIQRDPCFGDCPVYSAVLYDDGTVVYTGVAHVDNIGVSVLKTDATSIDGLVAQAQALGYFDWKDSYDQMVMTDQSTVTTSISSADQFKQISRYNGDPNAPVGLTWIEDSIDRLVTSAAS